MRSMHVVFILIYFFLLSGDFFTGVDGNHYRRLTGPLKILLSSATARKLSPYPMSVSIASLRIFVIPLTDIRSLSNYARPFSARIAIIPIAGTSSFPALIAVPTRRLRRDAGPPELQI